MSRPRLLPLRLVMCLTIGLIGILIGAYKMLTGQQVSAAISVLVFFWFARSVID